LASRAGGRRAAVSMFELSSKPSEPEEVVITGVTRSGALNEGRTGTVVVTDGSDSFYVSRSIFQMLYDFGNFASIVASSSSTADAKKMLTSRAARYSGLSGVLTFEEGSLPAFTGADTWLAIDPPEETLSASIIAAADAGVKRALFLVSSARDDAPVVQEQLSAAGIEYTLMRCGPMVAGSGGVGLKLDEVDMPVCADVPREDVFRFATEALTLPEAAGRAFSLCPAPGVDSTLKQLRLCGYERRDEVQLLLQGVVREPAEETELTSEEAAEQQELVLRSEAEVAAEREEELKALLERARQRGVETQQRLAFEEAERLAKRKEQEKYYSKPDTDGGDAPDDIPDSPPKADETPPAA